MKKAGSYLTTLDIPHCLPQQHFTLQETYILIDGKSHSSSLFSFIISILLSPVFIPPVAKYLTEKFGSIDFVFSHYPSKPSAVWLSMPWLTLLPRHKRSLFKSYKCVVLWKRLSKLTWDLQLITIFICSLEDDYN